MADVKINQLPNKTTLADTDVVIVESATSTNKMTVAKLKELLGIDGGGIVESGTNENGYYTKYSDGTLICRHIITINATPSVGTEGTWTFPVPFLNITGLNVQATIAFDSSINFSSNIRGRTSTNTRVNVRHDFASQLSVPVALLAIGRWK
jgi:hypothetical protein